MVLPHDPAPWELPNGIRSNAESGLPMAAVTDRALAFAFDLCLWAPLSMLVTKATWRDFQLHQMIEPGSAESIILFATAAFFSILFMLIIQTLMIWAWGVTPGKKLLNLRVESVDGGRLSLGASFLRAILQWLELVCLGLPFLEILSHPERRPWHDRIAESRVVSMRQVLSKPPHFLETRFFRNLYWGFSLSFLMMVGLFLNHLHHQVKSGSFKSKELEESGYLCHLGEEVPSRGPLTALAARADYVLAQYEVGLLSRECLESESDFSIWTNNETGKPWAHLLRAVLLREQLQQADLADEFDQHLTEACPESDLDSKMPSTLCGLVKYYRGGPLPEESAQESWAGLVLSARQEMSAGRFAAADKIWSSTAWPETFSGYVQSQLLRSYLTRGDRQRYEVGYKLMMPTWSATRRLEQMTWGCFAELIDSCSGGAGGQCQDLRAEIATQGGSDLPRETALVSAFEMKCHTRHDPQLLREVDRTLGGDSETAWVIQMLRPESRKTSEVESPAEVTRRLSESHWARPYYLWWLTRQQGPATSDAKVLAKKGSSSSRQPASQSPDESVQEWRESFAATANKDWTWWLVYNSGLTGKPPEESEIFEEKPQ